MDTEMTKLNLIPFRDKYSSVLPSSHNNLLLLNPVMMESLNLKKGSCALLNSTNGFLLLRSWPSESIDLSDVSLPAFSLFGSSTYSQASVEPFRESVLEADCIILSPLHINIKLSYSENLKAFKEFLKNELSECFIREGMVLKPNYCHFCCQTFLVKQVYSFNENNHLQKNTEDSKASELSFSNCNDDSFMLEESFNIKCRISLPGSTERKFQSSTPISSPMNPSFKKQSSTKLPETKNPCFYLVTSRTNFVIEFNNSENKNALKSISGLEKQLDLITSRIKCLFNPVLKSLSRGLLISGSSGTGKSMVISALQHLYKDQLSTFVIDEYTKSRRKKGRPYVKQIFKDAKNNLPCIVFIEDVHNLCKTGELADQEEIALREELTSMIYNLLSFTSYSMVIATCRSASSVFKGLQKPGILNEEICFQVPSTEERKQILCSILHRFEHNLTSTELSEVIGLTHGYVGDDLSNLCRKAHQLSSESGEIAIKFSHLVECSKLVKPKSMAEFSFKVPNVKWEDIGGMENVKRTIIEMVEWPLKYPDKLKHFQIKVPRGILMYGPPGCCKTMIVKALASESGLNFINVRTSEVFGKYVGDSEKSVSELFRKARSASPCVLFMDEIDSLAPKRGSSCGNSNVSDRVLTQLLVEIDGVDVLEQGIYVIAATNRPDNIDPSLLRPGRFDRMMYVPLPDTNTRRDIFKVILKKTPLSPDVDQPYLISKTEGYTGAEIAQICSSACMMAIKENPTSKTNVVTMAHLLKSLMSVQPRTTKQMIKLFEAYHEKQLCKSL